MINKGEISGICLHVYLIPSGVFFQPLLNLKVPLQSKGQIVVFSWKAQWQLGYTFFSGGGSPGEFSLPFVL